MKNMIVLSGLVFSFAFGRLSEGKDVVSPPDAVSFLTRSHAGLVTAKDFVGGDASIKWKRRHKRRKQIRGRQRGR